ncbi:MAG: hypothetical protein K8S56_10520 [Candidatus Cloacimonetes bacterium]|nr:hypothetical protein [Candidatus Cloacimonadota bacterium]
MKIVVKCCGCGRLKLGEDKWTYSMAGLFSNERVSHGICPTCLRILYPKHAEQVLANLEQRRMAQTTAV